MIKRLFSFLLLVWLPTVGQGQNWDVELLDDINPQYPTSVFWTQTSHSAYWVPAVTSLGMLSYGLIKKDRQVKINAAELMLNIGLSTIITQVMKRSIGRTRPADKYPELIYPDNPNHDNQSFPSGHTSLAFATATTLTLEYKKWYVAVPAFAWAGSVGYSRMYLGKHYPTDIIGGIVVGMGSGYLSHWLSKKLFYPKPSKVEATE